jgi:hypothetical protein
MKIKEIVPTLIMLSLIMILETGAISSTLIPIQTQNDNLYEIMFSISTSENGIHYENAGVPEALTWGPAAFTISTDGDFWIADTVGNSLLRYSSNGDFLSKIDLAGLAVGATDLIVDKDSVLVLDQASLPPKILRLNAKGIVLGVYDLPQGLYLENGLTGIALGDQGDILIEREFGASVTPFLNNKGDLLPKDETDGYVHNGKFYSAHISGLTSANPKHGEIHIDKKLIGIDTANDLGGLQILGFGPDGDFYLIVEELALYSTLQVDQTIRHYDADGKLLGIARMPLDEQYTYVAQDFALGQDGNLYALATRPDRVDILRLNFFQKLSPILKNDAVLSDPSTTQIENHSPLACVSRDTMISTASGYFNNSKYLNATNTDGACSGRGKPRYISGAGTYPSVSYDYGGSDTVRGFNGYMDPNTYQAGDINTAASENCSKGVDCSGFVSRVWQLTTKYGTCTLEGISTQLSSTSQLIRGDIMNKCNVHTMVFMIFNGSTGFYDYEATIYNSYDRVVYIASTWSRVSTYLPRRYNNVCT